MMRIHRVAVSNAALLEIDGPVWSVLASQSVALSPSPVAMVAAVSPLMALSTKHGKVKGLSARMAHNGVTLNVRISWEDPDKDDRIEDLDRFVDAAAVLFPLGEDANPFTMGDDRNPVNAWFWKADREEPFDVIARGYSTSQRRPGGASGLVARAEHRQGAWVVVFQRPLRPAPGEFTHFEPGATARVAFAVWEGNNADRGGQKAVSGAFLDLKIDS